MRDRRRPLPALTGVPIRVHFGRLLALLLMVCSLGCAHESLTPEVSNVKAGRETPSGDCVELSKVTGSTSTVHGTPEQALEDLKKDTANKGGNYVRIDQYSSYGTGVTGTAYRCK